MTAIPAKTQNLATVFCLAFLYVSALRATTPTTTTLTVSPSAPATLSQPVTLTAMGLPGESGTVIFYDGVTELGSSPMANNVATFTTTQLPSGTRSLRARFTGTITYSPSLSSPVAYRVSAIPADTFLPPASYPLPSGSQVVRVADFNGDGNQDLAIDGSVAGQANGNVYILLGNGDGTFQSPAVIAIPYANGMIVCDCNNDGKPDLALTSSDGVLLLFGNGDGTFQPSVQVHTGEPTFALTAADLNGDGLTDLVAANNANNTITVLLGGSSGLAPAADYPAAPGPVDVASADFNGDGIPDIIVQSWNNPGSSAVSQIFLGQASGALSLATAVGQDLTATSVLVADFNGDGRPDFVVATSAEFGFDVYLQNSDGTFASSQNATLSGPLSVTNLATADVNGDGIPDLILGDINAVAIGRGDGTFQPAIFYASAAGGNYVAVGDFNRDGRVDFVSAAQGSAAESIFLGSSGSCALSGAPASASTDPFAASPVVVPINVSGASTCGWAAVYSGSPNPQQIVAADGLYGTGAGDAVFNLQPNSGAGPLTATLTIYQQSLGPVATVAIAQPQITQLFDDVPPTVYYYQATELLKIHGVTAGCSVNPPDYCPDDAVTRAEMAILIIRAVVGSDNFTYSPSPVFTDVGPSDFGFAWIQKLSELGITAGCGNNQFCPNDTVTRDEMAIFIVRARYGSNFAFAYPSAPSFIDVPPTDYAFPWVQRLSQDGITAGCGGGAYCPSDNVTRGDMSIFIVRGLFNELLSPSTQVLFAVNPAAVAQGASTTVAIRGSNFQQGVTQILAPPGLTAGPVTVTTPETLTVLLTADPNAPVGPISLIANTAGSYAVLPNVFQITAGIP